MAELMGPLSWRIDFGSLQGVFDHCANRSLTFKSSQRCSNPKEQTSAAWLLRPTRFQVGRDGLAHFRRHG
jgi:hypothetical protein